MTSRVCDAINQQAIDQSSFFDSNGVHWDYHRIGWLVAGIMAILTIIISGFSIFKHCRNYHVPLQQKQIVRILLMPPVYATISFFSYRFFRTATYFTLAESIWEAFAIAAFLFLLVQYIGDTTTQQKKVLGTKEKRKVPFPFGCWRYRPSKPYFLQTLKWSVLQYCIFRPLITIISMICEAKGVLCPEQYSIYFAEVYLEAFDFVVFSVALYGLIIFYVVTKEQLAGRQPLAKFLTIKGIVMVTFYQGFVFSVLQKYNIIKETEFWTATNVSEGLQALCTTVEMVIFSLVMCWSFSWKSYADMSTRHTNSTRSFFNALNFSDFVIEIWRSIMFYVDYARGKPYTTSKHQTSNGQPGGLDFDGAYDYGRDANETYIDPDHIRNSLEMGMAHDDVGGRLSTAEKTPALGKEYRNGGKVPGDRGLLSISFEMDIMDLGTYGLWHPVALVFWSLNVVGFNLMLFF